MQSLTHLYVLVLVSEMLGDELDCLGGLVGLGCEEHRVRGVTVPPDVCAVLQAAPDLTVGVVHVGQLHRLHFGFGVFGRQVWTAERRPVPAGRVSPTAGTLHHPPQTSLPGPLHK